VRGARRGAEAGRHDREPRLGGVDRFKYPREAPHAYGIRRSRGGLRGKVHLVFDGRVCPLGRVISTGNINDTTMKTIAQTGLPAPTVRSPSPPR
jgi:hypothetical protein